MVEVRGALALPGRERVDLRRLRTVAIVALLCLCLLALAPWFLGPYTVNILVRSFLYAAAALTVDLLWGYTGILTFGQSAFFGIGAYSAGLFFAHAGFTPELAAAALVAGIVVAMLVAALVGWLSFWQGASPFYVTVVTLVLSITTTQIIFSGGTFTGSSSGLAGFQSFDLSVEAWFWIAGSGLVLLTAATWIFVHSDAGRILISIRENEQRCEYLGIHTHLVKTALLVVGAAIAAAAGYAYAGYTIVVVPELTNFTFGTELVIWVALAGRGTVIGPVIGTILIDLTSAYLSGSLPFVWRLLLGISFVAVIVALPEGLMPAVGRLFRRLMARERAPRSDMATVQVVQWDQEHAERPGSVALELRDVRRSFGSLQVLKGITFSASRGELISIVGPNGAGKSTLLHSISDGKARSGGDVIINGHAIGQMPPPACVALGIGRKFQTANIFDTLTVSECLRVSRTRHEWPSFWHKGSVLKLPRSATQILETTGLSRDLDREARSLSHGMKQALELAMVLALEPSVLLLDEPTAGLTKHERDLIGAILTNLVREHGLCVLLIEHDLQFVREISSRIVVLHHGLIALDGTVAEVAGSELIREIYSGHSGSEVDAHG